MFFSEKEADCDFRRCSRSLQTIGLRTFHQMPDPLASLNRFHISHLCHILRGILSSVLLKHKCFVIDKMTWYLMNN